MKYINAEDILIEYRNLISEEKKVYVSDTIKNLYSTATELVTLSKNISDKNIKQYNMYLVFRAQYYHGLLVEHYAYNNIEPWDISNTLKEGINYLNYMEMSIHYLRFMIHQVKLF